MSGAMAMVNVEAKVTGPDGFYYVEGRTWGALSDDQLAMIAEFLADMAYLAQDLGAHGEVGDLTVVLRQEGLPGAQPELVIEGFSKQDMTRFQHRFSNEWCRLIDKFDDRRRGRGKKK